MKTALAFLLLISASLAAPTVTAPKPPVGVPADAKHFNGKWYRVYQEKMPWNRANERCKQLGGQLAVIPDAETWKFVKTLSGNPSVWLGATDEKTDGLWLWLDGTTVSFSDWFSMQPDNSRGSEHYLATYKGQWNDAPKSGEFMPGQFVVGFVCQWNR